MLTIYLVRHPATEGGNIIKGNEDIPLKPGWEPNVDNLAEELYNEGHIDGVFASDLQRSKLPAQRLVEKIGP